MEEDETENDPVFEDFYKGLFTESSITINII